VFSITRDRLKPEIAQAVLECAWVDVESEAERTRSLDAKLTGIASLAGLALSIGASVGATVVASGNLRLGFAIAVGAVLSLAAILLLAAAIIALKALSPMGFEGISLEAAKGRVTDQRLSGDPADEIAHLAATYSKKILPQARKSNGIKVKRVRYAYWFVGAGLLGLVCGLILTSVAAVA
jgi:hypothetical protein